MFANVLRYAYERLGERYPRAILILQFQLAHIVVFGGVALLTLYQRMSHADFWRIVVVAELFVVVDNLMSTRVVLRLLRPATEWLRGRRDPDTTVAAWRALAGLPMDYMRAHWRSPVIVTVIPVCIFITAVLGKPWYTVFILIGGGLVTLAYGLILRFLAIELAMRPVIEDVSTSLPDGANLGTVTIPLRWKLLAGLPIINIITGVVVSGLSTNGTHQLSDLGLDVVVAVIVAFTISLELTLLLAKSILEPLESLRDATRRVGRGDLSARVPVTSTDETGSLSRAFNNAVAGLQERQQLREAFGAFVDPDLAERVLSEGHVLEGEDVEVTVLFLDIRGFTAFAERSSAREVVTRLNDFYDLVVPILLKHGGHANKFVGDGLLGLFGAPDRRPDHADLAVAAALEISEKVRERYGDLYIGIGVNSGPVTAGTIGGGGRVEFTVIGDPVNTAARVEEVTRVTGDEILITEATRCLLTREHCELEERPPAELKGKTERVRLWAVLDGPAPGGDVALSATGDPAS